jgi:hypothetical protein
MGAYAAPAGLATSAIGTGINAQGQHEALGAMKGVWKDARNYDAAANAQMQDATNRMIAGAQGQMAGMQPNAAALQAPLNASSINAANAVKTQAGRRTGGARANTTSKAVAAGNNKAALASAIKRNQALAFLQAMGQSGMNMDMLGRSFGLEQQTIRGDARNAAKLAPMYERAASFRGSTAREMGNLFNTLGQGAMSYGMAQPSENTRVDAALEDFQNPSVGKQYFGDQ